MVVLFVNNTKDETRAELLVALTVVKTVEQKVLYLVTKKTVK